MTKCFSNKMWILAGLAALVLAGCGGSSGDSTGTLSVSMTDATLPGFQAIYVTVDEVQVHPADAGEGENAWVTVSDSDKTVDLLELVNGVREELGVSELSAGPYTQMRLILGSEPDNSRNLFDQPHPHANYFVDDTGETQELKVPSGLKTGIKIVKGFDINENQTTELVLDFDAKKSVVRAGSSGMWLLKPTIKMMNTETWAVVRGTVNSGSTLLEGVSVSAQTYNPDAGDIKDEVVVEAATVTEENGEFVLFLEPGSYNLVAAKIGDDQAFGPGCRAIEPESDSVLEGQDFDLIQTEEIGSIGGSVEIIGGSEDQHATLSFRQSAACSPAVDEQAIEVAGVNVAHEGTYSVTLPVSDYDAVGWTFGKETVVDEGIVVEDGLETTVDFTFE